MRLARLLTMAGMGIVALGAMYAGKPAQGAMIVNQYAPDNTTSPTKALVDLDITNPIDPNVENATNSLGCYAWA